MPALLPKELTHYQNVNSGDALFSSLIRNPKELVLFFDYACGDETWSESHPEFMKKTINWLTFQGFQDKLDIEWLKQSAKAIQDHFAILSPFIPYNIVCQLNDTSVSINSLLFSAASTFFKDILRRECREKNKMTFSLKIPYSLYKPIEEYVNTGKIAYLWKHEQDEIMAILQLGGSWGLDGVVSLCEEALQRYITPENALEMFLLSRRELWPRFKEECIHYINELNLGFLLFPGSIESVIFEFKEFKEISLEYFKKLSPFITELIIGGNLNEDSSFSEIIAKCPKLRSLNISGSSSLTENLYTIPKNLETLNVSQCSWLNNQSLKKIASICPSLKKMILTSNTQLNFVAWGELSRFRCLESLDLSRCHQISDDDFSVILRACRSLKELILDECKKISDKGYFELSKALSRLANLNLSRCSITDLALIEIAIRCHRLTVLNLMRCENITEKGILGLAKHANMLKELNLIRCNIPNIVINDLKTIKPYLTIKN